MSDDTAPIYQLELIDKVSGPIVFFFETEKQARADAVRLTTYRAPEGTLSRVRVKGPSAITTMADVVNLLNGFATERPLYIATYRNGRQVPK